MQRVELSLWNRILRTVNVFLVIYGFKCGFPGLLVSGDSRKIRVVAKLGRLVRSNVVVGLSAGFWVHPFLKSTNTESLSSGNGLRS
jgi:hypothetical protein